MSVRATFAMILLSLALPAVASDAGMAATGSDGSTCSSDYAASAAPDPDPARSSKPAADKPVIPRGTGTGTDANTTRQPRWHSFLPGMFR